MVNYWREHRRLLKVFDCNVMPLFESETYNTLLAPTSFKAQGNFIACAATDGIKNKIVIFEKNCQVKSTFWASESRVSFISNMFNNLSNNC